MPNQLKRRWRRFRRRFNSHYGDAPPPAITAALVALAFAGTLALVAYSLMVR